MPRWDAARALPEPASTKYRRLAGIAQDRQAAFRRAYDAVEDAREAAAKARVQYLIAERSPRHDPEAIARLNEPNAEDEAEIARLVVERDDRSARSAGITRLVARIDNYVGDLNARTKITLFSGSLPARKKGEAPVDAVARCRKEIEKLRERIAEIDSAPRPLDELIARATAEIEALANRGAPDVDGLIDAGLAIGWATRPLDLLGRSADGMVIALNGSSVDTMATLAWLFKRQLTDAVVAAVREASGPDDDAIPIAARPKMLASVRTSLLELERIEETAVEEIEATGAMFERRPDADPRAVLGLASDLRPPSDDL